MQQPAEKPPLHIRKYVLQDTLHEICYTYVHTSCLWLHSLLCPWPVSSLGLCPRWPTGCNNLPTFSDRCPISERLQSSSSLSSNSVLGSRPAKGATADTTCDTCTYVRMYVHCAASITLQTVYTHTHTHVCM